MLVVGDHGEVDQSDAMGSDQESLDVPPDVANVIGSDLTNSPVPPGGSE
jgi:hypothetical protein